MFDLTPEDFKNDLHSPEEFNKICQELSGSLRLKMDLDMEGILFAISGIETNHAKNNVPRFESAYAPGGRYFNPLMKELYEKFGAWACCSYGPWQIMTAKAYELGFDAHPSRLWNGRVSGPLVVKLLNKIVESGAQSMEQVLDAYNTGSFRVGLPPQNYITRFWGFYGDFVHQKLDEA